MSILFDSDSYSITQTDISGLVSQLKAVQQRNAEVEEENAELTSSVPFP